MMDSEVLAFVEWLKVQLLREGGKDREILVYELKRAYWTHNGDAYRHLVD